jgi:hypothetical protein
VNTEKWQHSPLCSGNGIAPNPGCSCGLVSWLYREAERNADEGGSAGTGAAPPDLRDRVRDDWTAGYKAGQESGVPPSPEGANERFERIAAEFYEDTGYLRPGKDVPAAVGGESYDRERNAAWKIWNAARVRGGAAQPPPSAPEQANSRWVQTIVRSPLCQAEGHLPSGDDSYCLRCGAVQEGEK